MRKSIDLITDTIRTAKHPFHQADDRPRKGQKHRYERRKVREYLRIADWMGEDYREATGHAMGHPG